MPPRPVSHSIVAFRSGKPDPHPPFSGPQRVGSARAAQHAAQGNADRPARFFRLQHRRDHLPRAESARSWPGASRAKFFAATTARFPSSLQPYLDRPDFEQQERAEEAESFRARTGRLARRRPGRHAGPSAARAAHRVENRVGLRSARVARADRPARQFAEAQGRLAQFLPGARPLQRGGQPARAFQRRGPGARCAGSAISCPLLLTDKNRVASPFLNDNRSLLTWLTQWGTSGRCHWEDGAPVEFSPLSARIVPQLHPAAATDNGAAATARGSISISKSSPPPGLREPLENARLFLAPKSDHPRPGAGARLREALLLPPDGTPAAFAHGAGAQARRRRGRCRRRGPASAAAAAPLSASAAAGQSASAPGPVADQILLPSRRGRRAADPPQGRRARGPSSLGMGRRRLDARRNRPTPSSPAASRTTTSTSPPPEMVVHEKAARRTALRRRRPCRQRRRNLGRRSRRCRHAHARWPGCAASRRSAANFAAVPTTPAGG